MDDIKKISETQLEVTSKSYIEKDALLRQRAEIVQNIEDEQDQLKQIDDKLTLFEKG